MQDDILTRFIKIPAELRIPIIGNVVLFAANLVWSLSLIGTKIDPGLATLLGATFGFAVVGWQTNRGFRNLIRSQANQAQLDREARLHKAELEENSKEKEAAREMKLLLSGLRAELAAVYSKVLQQVDLARQSHAIFSALHKRGVPSNTKEYRSIPIDAPLFKESLGRIGLLGTDLGADIIKVMSRADGVAHSMTFEAPIGNDILATLSAGRHSYLMKWSSDLYHVAMRIRSTEEGTADPGSLINTETTRYADIVDLE